MQLITAPDAGFEIPQTQSQQAAKSFDLHEIWATIYRSRLWIAGTLAVCIAAAIMYSMLATRLYKSEVSIEVRQEAEKVLGTEADQEGATSKIDSDRFLQTQLEILRSREVAQQVAETLGLYRGEAFLETMNVEAAETGTPNQTVQQIRRQQVEDELLSNVDVEFTGNTRIARLTFVSPDPQLSARVANAYADSFIRNNLARKFDSSAYALQFLRDRLAEAQQRLEQAERQALAYSRRLRLVDPSNAAGNTSAANPAGPPQSLIAAQLIELNAAYSGAQADRIAAEQRWRRTQAMPDMKIPEVLGNPAVQALLDRRAESSAAYQQQLSTRQADYPGVVEASAERNEFDRQIRIIARDVRDSVKSQYDVAVSRERRLASQIERLKSQTLQEQSQSIELSILRRAAETSRGQYDSLLRRYNALNAEAGVQTNNLSIVDRARIVEAPYWPRLGLILALATFVGLLLSFILVVLREQLFDAIRVPQDVVNRLHLPLLGVVPQTNDVETDLADPKSPLGEAVNSVRTALALSEGGMPRTLLFTSSQAGEGKSSSCHALALSIARLDKKVVVIDADLRRPNSHRLFNAKNDVGLSNVLAGLTPLTDAVQTPVGYSVDLLPAGDLPPNPSELVNSPQFLAVVSELAAKYDVVLIDSAPVLGIADAIILASEVQSTVFVIEAGRNSVRGATNALSRLRQGGANIAGALLTKYDAGRFGYGYGQDYVYEYRYQAA